MPLVELRTCHRFWYGINEILYYSWLILSSLSFLFFLNQFLVENEQIIRDIAIDIAVFQSFLCQSRQNSYFFSGSRCIFFCCIFQGIFYGFQRVTTLQGIIHLVRTKYFLKNLHFLHPDTHTYVFLQHITHPIQLFV